MSDDYAPTDLSLEQVAAFEDLLTRVSDLEPANLYLNDFGEGCLTVDLRYDDRTYLTVELVADTGDFSVSLTTVDASDDDVEITGNFGTVENTPDPSVIEKAIRDEWSRIPEHAAELSGSEMTWGVGIEFDS